MKVDVTKLEKHYYSIGEVAEIFDVATSLIRYWDSEFSTLRPSKSKKGDRKFKKKDIEQLNLIYNLVKDRGFTIDGARKEITLLKKKQLNKREIVKELTFLRQRIQGLQLQLAKA
jgi:DNA-binding transcriptional MerR regulator